MLLKTLRLLGFQILWLWAYLKRLLCTNKLISTFLLSKTAMPTRLADHTFVISESYISENSTTYILKKGVKIPKEYCFVYRRTSCYCFLSFLFLRFFLLCNYIVIVLFLFYGNPIIQIKIIKIGKRNYQTDLFEQ